MAERLQHLPDQAKQAESRSLCRRLLADIPERSVICAYYPLATEPDVRPLLEELIARGDAVYLPRYLGGRFDFFQIEDLKSLTPGDLKIPEPSGDSPVLNRVEANVVLIPGRAFDHAGNRLGRGAGGYDAWIAEQRKINPKTRLLGVAYECQMVNEIPREAHDQTVDAVITARG